MKTNAAALILEDAMRAANVRFEKESALCPLDGHHTRKTRWRIDYLIPDKKLIVELDGGVHSFGGHVRGVGYERGCLKQMHAAKRYPGWAYLRIPANWLTDAPPRKSLAHRPPASWTIEFILSF